MINYLFPRESSINQNTMNVIENDRNAEEGSLLGDMICSRLVERCRGFNVNRSDSRY